MKIIKKIKGLLPLWFKRPIRNFINHKFYGYPYDVATFDKNRLIKTYKRIGKYNINKLTNWLDYNAGSQNPKYFNTNSVNGLMLQQIPNEYAHYLMWLRQQKIEHYLEVGIGSGSSFFINNIFMKNSIKSSTAVDNTSYDCFGNQLDKINEKVELLKLLNNNCEFIFINDKSENFFKRNQKKFDLIFIDGDHEYLGVKSDYERALRNIKHGGYIIFHDIASKECPGVVKLWQEIKNNGEIIEYIAGTTCGIGIIKPIQK